MQKCMFIMDTYNLTQGYDGDTYSHAGTYAMDIAGKDRGIENAYAPFDCYVYKKYKKTNVANTVWYASKNEVMCADGKARKLTLMLVHDNDIDDMVLGTKFKQGDIIFQEGMSGNATGNHIHMELGEGKCYWHKNSKGVWMIDNALKPDEMMFITENTTVKNVMYNGWNYKMALVPEDFEELYNDEVKLNTDLIADIDALNKKIDNLSSNDTKAENVALKQEIEHNESDLVMYADKIKLITAENDNLKKELAGLKSSEFITSKEGKYFLYLYKGDILYKV